MININFNQVFLLNSNAVPRLGNVQLRFHFLRRGTSEVYFPTTLFSNNGGIGTKPNQDIEISISINEVSINSNSTSSLFQIQVSDVLGRIVGSYNNINSKQFSLPSTQFQKGVYLIKVLNTDGKVYTSKIQR